MNTKINESVFGHGTENKFMQAMNKMYLPDSEYWYYAFHPIVIYHGGITASALQQSTLFMNKEWMLFVDFNEDTGSVIGRIKLKDIVINEVNTKGFLAKIQKRDYLMQINDVEVAVYDDSEKAPEDKIDDPNIENERDLESKEDWSDRVDIQIISLKSPNKRIQDKQATKDLMADILKASHGEELLKPWHEELLE